MSLIQLISEKCLADLLGISVKKLQNDRWLGQGIPYIRMNRTIRYSLDDVEEYLNKNRIRTNFKSNYKSNI